jgi:beta-phosphoglucomutase
MSKKEQEEFCSRKNEIYLEYIRKMKEDEILPGVKEFLTEAKQKGYKIALGSASKNSVLILTQLQLMEYFDEIVDGTKVYKAKPDPEVFIKGAEVLGLENHECIVFEDAVAGIQAAHGARMKAVGIGSKEALPEADFHMAGFMNVTIEQIELQL